MQKLFNLFKKHEIIIILSCFIVLIISIFIVKDLLFAQLSNTEFNLQVTLLSKIVFALFLIPIMIYSQWRDLSFSHKINLTEVMAHILIISLLHILISSWLVMVATGLVLDESITYAAVFKKHISNDLIYVITIYGLLLLMVRYYAILIKKLSKSLMVFIGHKKHFVYLRDINWVEQNRSSISICANTKLYRYHKDINALFKVLSNEQFIRINPSIIVNKTKITGIVKRSDGNYDVQLEDSKVFIMNPIYKKALQ